MTRATLLLTEADVLRLVDMRTAIRIVRHAFRALAQGRAVMPSKLYLPLPRESDFRAMPAYLEDPPACGIKWVNVHPHNTTRGLPTIMALLVLNDPATGFPVAVVDGLAITKIRTAAAAAVAAKALGRRASRVVGLVGCGAQAESQILALREVLPIRVVNVWGYGRGEAQRFCRRASRHLPGVRLVPTPSIKACVREVDIVVTVTPSRRPLVQRRWLKIGVHINAIGADAPGKQELDPRILREGVVIVDDRDQAIHGGELNVPVARGQFHPRQIRATLGEVLVGRRPGRRRASELTVFDSTGLAVHDIALGAELVRRARRRKVGRSMRFFAS
jgi:alanine dehydrogenase